MKYLIFFLFCSSWLWANANNSSSQKFLVRYKTQFNKSSFSSATTLKVYLFNETLKTQKRLFDSHENAYALWVLNASIVSLDQDKIEFLRTSEEVLSITPLGRKASINQTSSPYVYGLKKIKLPEANKIYPEILGTGVKVGIIDTGVDARHPDLINKVLQFKDFIKSNSTVPYDDHGHGTHVAGTIAGNKNPNKLIGVAPEARLIIAKAFSSYGGSSDEGLLKSLQWMADPDGNPNTSDQPQIISNSWNLDDADYSKIDPKDEPFCVVIENLNSLGIAIVFASGNDGPRSGSIKTPASCPAAISVGATNESDGIADFSSRGPVKWKSVSFIKPDISAPGDGILSAEPGGGYRTRSGTSMAAPHVSGLLALLYQLQNDLSPEDAKKYLLQGADDLGAPGLDNLYGIGRANSLNSISILKSSGVHPGKVIGKNDLITVAADASNIPEEFRALVEAIGWTNYGCTVTHIGNGYALSAGHCFEAKPELELNDSCSFVTVEWGYRQGKKPTLKSDCEKIVAKMTTGPIDFALLKMKTYPKTFIRPNLQSKALSSSTITLFSHPDGRPLNWSQFCAVENLVHAPIPAGYLQYPCDTEGGSSGAAIIDPTNLAIVGLHAGGELTMNYGTHILETPLEGLLKDLGFE